MSKALLFLAFLIGTFGLAVWAQAEDVVYLKDGSIIHGTITEEVPGVSVKIQTQDGNVFVYQVKQVSKITHSAPGANDEQGDEAAPAAQAAPPAEDGETTVVVVKHRRRPVMVNDYKTDPAGQFSIGAFYFGLGLMNPSVINQFNDILTKAYGSSYDFTPLTYAADIGFGWYTNHLALKFTATYGANWEQQNYYYNSYNYYNLNEYLEVYGGELEADLSLDDVQTSKTNPRPRVASIYLPLTVGWWQSSLTTYDNYNNSDVLTGNSTSFGTGLGCRFIDEHHNMFDIQCLYRWSNSSTMTDPYGYYLIRPDGNKFNSSVAGLDFNINYGITF